MSPSNPSLIWWCHQHVSAPPNLQTPGTLFSLIVLSHVATGVCCPRRWLPWQHRHHHQGDSWWLVITEVSLPGGGATQDILHRVTAPSRGRKYLCLQSESSAISGYCVNLRGGKTKVKYWCKCGKTITVIAESGKESTALYLMWWFASCSTSAKGDTSAVSRWYVDRIA